MNLDAAALNIESSVPPETATVRKPKLSPFTPHLLHSWETRDDPDTQGWQSVTQLLSTELEYGSNTTELDTVRNMIRSAAYKITLPDGMQLGVKFRPDHNTDGTAKLHFRAVQRSITEDGTLRRTRKRNDI